MGKNKKSFAIEWVVPKKRGLIPIGKIHCSRSLMKIIKKSEFTVSFNTAFYDVITNCANRKITWINKTILDQYINLHAMGLAHSVEIKKDKRLVGGLYGVTLGSVFFAESMFSKISNTSKLALIAMMAKINYAGFQLFDTQFPSKHLESLGGITVEKKAFEKMLYLALNKAPDFNRSPKLLTWDEFLKFGCGIDKNS